MAWRSRPRTVTRSSGGHYGSAWTRKFNLLAFLQYNISWVVLPKDAHQVAINPKWLRASIGLIGCAAISLLALAFGQAQLAKRRFDPWGDPKYFDRAFYEQMRSLARKIEPVRQEHLSAMQRRDFKAALEKIEQEKQFWVKYPGESLTETDEAECYFQLGDYAWVAQSHYWLSSQDPIAFCSMAIAYVHLGRHKAAQDLLTYVSSLKRKGEDVYSNYRPGIDDDAHLEAALWRARGHEWLVNSQLDKAAFDLEKADRLVSIRTDITR